MKKLAIAIFSIALLGIHLPIARAGYWSMNGGACQPDSDDIQSDMYEVNSGSIEHSSAKTAEMSFYCGVTYNQGASNPSELTVYYSSGIDTYGGHHIAATLYRKSISSGVITEIANIDGYVNVFSWTEESVSLSHTFNFTTSHYFVRIDMVRASTGNSLSFRGLELT